MTKPTPRTRRSRRVRWSRSCCKPRSVREVRCSYARTLAQPMVLSEADSGDDSKTPRGARSDASGGRLLRLLLSLRMEPANDTVATKDPIGRLAREPVSPELALVDPDLARYARERLPDPSAERLPPVTESRRERAAPPPSASPPQEILSAGAGAEQLHDEVGTTAAFTRAEDPSEFADSASVSAPSRTFLLVSAVLILAAVALAIITLDRPADDSIPVQGPAQGGIPAASAVKEARAAKPKPAPARPQKQSRQGGAPSTTRANPPASTAGSRRETTPRPPAATRPAKAHPIPTRSRAFGTRVFIWAAAEHATAYKVGFFRDGKQVFEALASGPRLELPLRWVYHGRRYRLKSGTYSWTVWPAFGRRGNARFGQPIVNSTWSAQR